MKKRISCKVIKSIPLGNTDGFCPNILNNIDRYYHICNQHKDSEVITYTCRMKIKKEINNNILEPSINFFA